MNLSSSRSREISVRKHPRTGELNEFVKKPAVTPFGEPRVIILIHGFNVTEEEAREGYSNFIEILREHKVPASYINKIWQFFWPGNRANSILSKATYAEQIPKARAAAELLSSFLRDICIKNRGTELLFVAHSLGCRLLAEALRLINAEYASQLKFAALMAAAIPSYMISAREITMHSGIRVVGLFSTRDRVLQLAFPGGQTMAGEGWMPKALGYCGEPKSFWVDQEARNTGLGHSDYWKNYRVARYIASKMGVAAPRDLVVRYISNREIKWDKKLGSEALGLNGG